MQATEKLQKVLARLGMGSRRELEKWIAEGRISINGQTAKLGDRVSAHDLVEVDGNPIQMTQEAQKTRVILYHKRIGEICTRHDDQQRPTVFDSLPALKAGRWISVGRLDVNTAGLLLFTDNGELADRLMRPKFSIEQEYAVRVLGAVSKENISNVMRGVELEDGVGRFDHLIEERVQGEAHWYHVVISENRNRLIRRLWESQGLTMTRLIRIRFGFLQLPRELIPGECQELSSSTIEQLSKM